MLHRCRAILRSRRGETLVEVLVAFVLLLLFISAFGASLRASGLLQRRADASRAEAVALTEQLRPATGGQPAAAADGNANYTFRSEAGYTAFTVEGVERQTVTVGDGAASYTFRQFAAPAGEEGAP